MAIIKTKDYRSDIVLTMHMTLGGETVNVPQHDFILRFFTENNARHYDCGRIKGELLHCAASESDPTELTCYIKNHGLGCGMLQCTYIDLSPNDGMEDGVQRTFSVSGIDLELVDDASDDTQAVDGSVIIDINAVLTELEGLQVDLTDLIAAATAATASANSAASAASSAAARADNATTSAHNAATSANQAASNANSAAAAAVQSQQKNIKSIVYIGAMGDGAANTVRITLNDGTEVTGSVFNGHTGAKGEDGVSVVFGRLSDGIFYDLYGREAVRSAELLYVSIDDGKMYRWGSSSYVYLGVTVDPQPTAGSSNPVSSGGVAAALEDVANVGLADVPFLENPDTSNPDVFNIYKNYAEYLAWVGDHRSSHLMTVGELIDYIDRNVGKYIQLLDAASMPEMVQSLMLGHGYPSPTAAMQYIELTSRNSSSGLQISVVIDRNGTLTATTVTAVRRTGLTTANYNGNTKVNEVSITATGVISKMANGATTTYNLPSSGGTLALASEVAGKQDALTFDSAPTYGSSNPVTSDGLAQEFDSVDLVIMGLNADNAIVGVVGNNNRVTFYRAVDMQVGNTPNPVSPADVLAALQRNTSFTIGLIKNDYIISRLHFGYLTYSDGDELGDGIVLIGPESVCPYVQSNGYAVVSVFTQNAIYVHKSTLSELDNAPVSNSDKLVSSGSVYTAIDNARTARAVAGWDTGQQAYVSRVSVDDMWSAFNTNGKVVELQLHDGSWNGSVLLCHGSYVDGNNARHLLFSGIVNGNLVEADVVGTAVSLSFLEISDVVTDLQALWTGKQDVSPITNAASGALVVNEYRDFGSVSALTVTLSGGTMANYDLYKFAFTCASDSTTLTLPSGIKLPVDMEMEMAAGRRFECTVDYAGCLTYNCWD